MTMTARVVHDEWTRVAGAVSEVRLYQSAPDPCLEFRLMVGNEINEAVETAADLLGLTPQEADEQLLVIARGIIDATRRREVVDAVGFPRKSR